MCLLVWLAVWTSGMAAPAGPGDARPVEEGASIFNNDAPAQIFDDKNGLPQNNVRQVTMDANGALWVGTGDGVAFFDGRTWHEIRLPNRTVSNDVMAMTTSKDGGMWFGTNGGGVLKYLDGEWTVYDKSAGLTNLLIFSLLETTDTEGKPVLYAGTFGGGLLRFADGKWSTFATEGLGLTDDIVLSLLQTRDPDGLTSLWVGTRNAGVLRYRNGEWTELGASRGLPNNYVSSLTASTVDGTWKVWAGTFGGGLCRFENDRWQVVTTRDGLPSDNVTALASCRSRDGAEVLWAATNRGLAYLKGGVWRPFANRRGLAGGDINSILKITSPDGFEALWIGSNGNGLGFYPLRAWRTFEPPPEIRTERFLVHSFVRSESEGGAVYWFGTATDGLFRSGPDGWRHYTLKNGLPDDRIRALYETRETDGTPVLWVATQGGLARFAREQWKIFTTADGLVHPETRSLLETRSPAGKPVLWIGTYNGLSRLEDGVWTTYNKQKGDLPNNGVNCLLETVARDGRRDIWAGTYGGGLARFDGRRWSSSDMTSGLPNNVVLSLTSARTPEGDTILWVGTNGAGAAWRNLDRPDDGWHRLNESTVPGLPNNTVYRIVSDSKGRLYFFTNKGIARLVPDYAGGRAVQSGDSYVFTTEDGLPSNECLMGSALADGAGRLWVGTSAGAAQLDLAGEILDRMPKPLQINAFAPLGPDRSFLRTGDVLDHRHNALTFEFTLMSLFRGADTRYRTQLVNFESDPSDWSAEGKREYTNLGPGDYQFKVWGRDYAGNVTGPVLLAFSVRPAPWRTPLAYLFYTVALIGGVYGVFAWRYRAVRKRQEERIRYLRRLLHSTRVINSGLDLETVLETIAEESANLVGGEPGGIGIVSGDAVTFRYLWSEGRWKECRVSFPRGKGIVGTVAETGLGIIVNDPSVPDILAFPEPFASRYTYGMIDVPIRSRAGDVVGVLDVRRKPNAPKFTDADREILEALAHQAAVAIENAHLYGELEAKNLLVVESMKELETLYRNEREVTNRLQELDRMKTNFISVTSHEMRTPLTVLRGHSEALLERLFGPLTEAQQRSLETCLSVVDRLTGTFNDLVEVLRFDRREIRLDRSRFDLGAMIHEVVGEFEPHAARRDLRLDLECDESFFIEADREKLRLALGNVVQNAVKFTPDGGKVEIGLIREGGLVNLTVRDEGIGIESSELDRIFDRFYTTADTTKHKSGKYEFATRGSGLGLSIAKSYIEAHGGTIRAESDGLGKGSCFRIRLPLADNVKMPAPVEDVREPATMR